MRLLVMLTGLLASTTVLGQTMPDAGSLQRDIDSSMQIPQTRPDIDVPDITPEQTPSDGARIKVNKFIIDGATLLPQEQLQAQVADLVGHDLNLAELQNAATRIANYYRQNGWFVRVILPQQDVTDGIIRLQVIEGKYGGSILDQQDNTRVNQGFVENVIVNGLRVGEPLAANKLERGLLLANDLPGVQATGVLEAGESFGETRLRVKVEDTALFTGDIGVNNYGIKSTGRFQAVGGIAVNNISGIGDQLVIRALGAKDIYSGVFRYSLPVGYDGLHLGINASALNYKLGKEYRSLNAKGTANTGGINLSYPIIRQTKYNLRVFTAYDHRRYNDKMLGEDIRRHRVNAFTIGLAGDRRDSMWGGGITWGDVSLTAGKLKIKNVNNDLTFDKAGPRTNGSYTKINFNLNRLQAVSDTRWQLFASLSGQWASKNLDSSERFSLGGPTRVRAYPVNEGTGDDALLFKFEIQRDMGNGVQAVAFFDTGIIRQHHNTWAGWQGGTNARNNYSLSGAGLGLNWRKNGFALNGSIAFPIGKNRGAINGRNNDNSRSRSPTFWLNLSYAFD